MAKGPSPATLEGASLFGLKLSPSPDWSGTPALIAVTLALGAVTCAILLVTTHVAPGFRDTDDAMRMVMVRDLVAGRGWYDQEIMRLDPPHGVWLHWSRLIDGGVGGLMIGLRQFMPPASAEYWTRSVWPLLWIFPGLAAALALARNLGGRSAVIIAAILLVVDVGLYRNFYPGRVDHHDVQIVMTVIAMACATARKSRAAWAVMGGAAAALGLAVGLEALPFQALIGASYGVALVRDRGEAAPARAYGLALAATTAALFLIQTPPGRWSMSFCDVLAFNLVAALVVAGLGLALAASARVGAPARLGLLAAVTVAAGATYLGLAPRCIRGPFADMLPAVRPFWFERVQEVQPLTKMLALEREPALVAAILMAMSVASATYLAARQWRSPGAPALLAVAVTGLAAAVACSVWRMQDYVFWIGLPTVAAAFSLLARRWLKDLMVPSLVVTLVLAPAVTGLAANAAIAAFSRSKGGTALAGAKPAETASPCFAQKSYAALAALPAGNVLAIQDLGPFILVFTHHSAMVAPYHRMSRRILEAHQFWNAPPGLAQSLLPSPHPDYVVDCPGYPMGAGPKSFGASLRAPAPPPAWLEVVSKPGAVLKIYKVRTGTAPG